MKLFALGREAAFISTRLGHGCLFVGRAVRPSAGLLPQRFPACWPPIASHNKSGHCALDSPTPSPKAGLNSSQLNGSM